MARPIAHLTRRYMFSASHRLHNPALGAEENRAVYGKCNNPYGHGHNYTLEVTVGGPVDPLTGMVVNLADLDAAVEQEVLSRFDHANLNLCSEYFAQRVPTSENLCVVIYTLLNARWSRDPAFATARLDKVRLEETRNNAFEYGKNNSGEYAESAERPAAGAAFHAGGDPGHPLPPRRGPRPRGPAPDAETR